MTQAHKNILQLGIVRRCRGVRRKNLFPRRGRFRTIGLGAKFQPIVFYSGFAKVIRGPPHPRPDVSAAVLLSFAYSVFINKFNGSCENRNEPIAEISKQIIPLKAINHSTIISLSRAHCSAKLAKVSFIFSSRIRGHAQRDDFFNSLRPREIYVAYNLEQR